MAPERVRRAARTSAQTTKLRPSRSTTRPALASHERASRSAIGRSRAASLCVRTAPVPNVKRSRKVLLLGIGAPRRPEAALCKVYAERTPEDGRHRLTRMRAGCFQCFAHQEGQTGAGSLRSWCFGGLHGFAPRFGGHERPQSLHDNLCSQQGLLAIRKTLKRHDIRPCLHRHSVLRFCSAERPWCVQGLHAVQNLYALVGPLPPDCWYSGPTSAQNVVFIGS